MSKPFPPVKIDLIIGRLELSLSTGRLLSGKSIDLSENSFLGALVIVASAVGSVVGVAALFIKDPITLVGITAGAAWVLSLCLFVICGGLRRRILQLENELLETKVDLTAANQRADHWSMTANNVSQSTLVVLQMVPAATKPPPRRTAAKVQKAQDQEEKETE